MSEQRPSSADTASLERISALVSDLEQELSTAPSDSPRVMALREELVLLRRTLSASDGEAELLRRRLHGTHGKLDDLLASVEGEVLRDTPYLAELGRILGLV
ncbi:MAG: hypothetical protein RLZZ20_648 [Pseudomonadota bacterium]|jgi:hypothetical protein